MTRQLDLGPGPKNIVHTHEEGGRTFHIEKLDPPVMKGAGFRHFRLWEGCEPCSGGQWHYDIAGAKERIGYLVLSDWHSKLRFLENRVQTLERELYEARNTPPIVEIKTVQEQAYSIRITDSAGRWISTHTLGGVNFFSEAQRRQADEWNANYAHTDRYKSELIYNGVVVMTIQGFPDEDEEGEGDLCDTCEGEGTRIDIHGNPYECDRCGGFGYNCEPTGMQEG